MINGITWDEKSGRVWVADSLENIVTEYRYIKDSKEVLTFERVIDTDGGCDNIIYDDSRNKLYLGTVYKTYNFF
jgi:sugar lactone lactonase YvrE